MATGNRISSLGSTRVDTTHYGRSGNIDVLHYGLTMTTFPALRSLEFEEACVQIAGAWNKACLNCGNSDLSGGWHDVKWTGEELRIRQSRKRRSKTPPMQSTSQILEAVDADIEDDHDSVCGTLV